MTPVLIGLGVISLVELLIWTAWPWRVRKVLASSLILTQSVFTGLLFGQDITVWTSMFLVLGIYRLINLLRIVENRMQPDHLWRSTRLTSRWLILGQLIILGLVALGRQYGWNTLAIWLYVLAAGQLSIATVLWLSTRRNIRAACPPDHVKSLTDKELPSLSVAIPARNETKDLEECLLSLLPSNYPKLEILVLDDCSQNKRTAGIIRDFAQDGVVFIAGQPPSTQWLAKNYAYEQLSKEASGDLLLFCGVDTRFKPNSLRAMVNLMMQENKQMISFIPLNRLPSKWGIQSLLIQPFRYAWELSLPRELVKRPPVLSTCWLITAKALSAAGSFEAVSHSISPESYMARTCLRTNNGYSFQQAGGNIGLVSVKNLSEQRATAVRTRYPQLHRRPELVSLLSLTELASLLLPPVIVGLSLWRHQWVVFVISFLASILLVDLYSRIVSLTYGQFMWRGLWTLPLAALYDVCLLKYSMWQYEFHEVIWKGRNICVPVMRTTRDLERRP